MPKELTPKKFYRMQAEVEDESQMKAAVEDCIERDPTSILPVLDAMTRYFTVDYIRGLLGKVIETEDPKKYMKYMPEIGRFLEDREKIRNFFIGYHTANPWYFYCYRDQLKDFFGPGYFEDLLKGGVNFFEDPGLFAIFRVFYADVPLDAHPAVIQEKLQSMLPDDVDPKVTVLAAREPGFACGGLERNYLEAKAQGEGLCIVNGQYMAKKFHRKGEGKKITLVPRETLRSEDTVVWKDHVYAPSQGMHLEIDEALRNGRKSLSMSHLAIRPVRPLINLTSEEIFR